METPASWIPFRWPAAWPDPSLLELLASTPVNCIITSDPRITAAARTRKLRVIDWNKPTEAGVAAAPLGEPLWTAPQDILAIENAVWPGVRATKMKSDAAEAGPTGAPWVDANGWSTELTRVLAPGKAVWLASKPPEKTDLSTEAYLLALADAAIRGARWIVNLDDGFATALAKGNAEARGRWQRIAAGIRVFAQNPWESFISDASLGVISTFTGDNEFLSSETLNLADRRNLLYRVIPTAQAASAKLGDLRAVLYLDPQPPPAALAARLESFAKDGGTLVMPAKGAPQGGTPMDSPVPGYRLRSLGKGRIATPEEEWEDPYLVAAAVHVLISRRADPVRLYNAGTFGCHIARSRDGRTTVVQLANYTTRPSSNAVTLGVLRKAATARIRMLEKPEAAPIAMVRRKHDIEFPLPPFAVWAAVEMEG